MSPIAWPNDVAVDSNVARTMGITPGEWDRVISTLGRVPSYAELGVISVMWSEHCSYKSSRAHLKRLPTKGPRVVQGPGENAGAVDIGDGFCAVFKIESHNHPSFIEPYQGAATGVGGILRDVFTMGARPIASLNSLRFGRPTHALTPRLLRGVVAGIGGYGNCIGVPTVGGEVQFDRSYDGNILVNAFALGIAKTNELFFGKATGVGNFVIYVGSRTGRDGIHGATMASAEFDSETGKKLPTVQVGDPFMEKLLLEACLEIFKADCLEGVQDMGAAGLTSSSVEMAERAGNGIELNLDLIPRRARGLSPYELLLSESQERMLMVAKKGREQEVFAICEKWDLDVAVVGKVTDTKRFVCVATPGYDPLLKGGEPTKTEVVVDLPIAMLTKDAPQYERAMQPSRVEPISLSAEHQTILNDVGTDAGRDLLSLLQHPNIGSRSWIWRQYDHIVRDGTVLGPGKSDAAVVRVFCDDKEKTIEKFLAVSADGNGRFVQLDPFQGAAMVVAECARNVVCSGAEPIGLTNCLNFASPENPETMWRFSRSVDGISEACRALGIPVVSGNVSLYNETAGSPILPTPIVVVVGQLRSSEDRLGSGFRVTGDFIYLIGASQDPHLGGSEYLCSRLEDLQGPPLAIDLKQEQALQNALLELARTHYLSSAHDISDGGFAVCLAESCIQGNLGAKVTVPNSNAVPLRASLFGETPSRVVISANPTHDPAIRKILEKHGVRVQRIGVVEGAHLEIESIFQLSVAELREAHARALDVVTQH